METKVVGGFTGLGTGFFVKMVYGTRGIQEVLAIVKKVRLCLAIGRVRVGVLGRKGKGMRGSVAELKRGLSGFLLCGQKGKIGRALAHTRKSSPFKRFDYPDQANKDKTTKQKKTDFLSL